MPYPWEIPAPPSGRRRPWEDDPAQLPEGTEEDQSPESWFTLPNALRIGGGVIGGVAGAFAGGPVGIAALGAAGAGAGEGLAELLEVRRHQRKELNPWQIGTQAAIGAVPLGKIGSVATGAIKGAGLGAGATVATSLAERGELPELKDVGRGALYGGAFGGAATGILSRFTRPRSVGAGQTAAAAAAAGERPIPTPPPPGSRFRSVVSPRFESFEPPPTVFPDPAEMAMAYQPNLPGAVQAGGRRMGAFDQGSNLQALPEGFEELNAILRGESTPDLHRINTEPAPSLERPLLPSGLDEEAPAIAPTPRHAGPYPWELPPAGPPEPLTRPEGPFPSMTRPLHPSGLDANPPSLTAPHPLDFLGPVDERGYSKVPLDVADPAAERALLENPDYSSPELRYHRIRDLVATQPTVTRSVVEEKLAQGARRHEQLPEGVHGRMKESEVNVVQGPDGRWYLAGGTHTAMGALGRGEEEIQAVTYPRKQPPVVQKQQNVDLPPELAAVAEPEPPVQSSRGGPQPPPPGREGHFKLPEAKVPDAEYEAIRDRMFGIEPSPMALAERRGTDVGPPPGSAERRVRQPAEAPPAELFDQPQPSAPERPAGPWDQNRAPEPSEPPTAVRTASRAPSGRGPEFTDVDPDTVGIDAKTYQFKGGGDAAGVTDRLKGVESWDPIAGEASPIIVHERANGQQYVVDGHQRLGLAKRLKAAGRSGAPDTMRAIVLREGDGVSVPQARRIGAMLNLQQGTGTATDVAKVLRESPLTSLERARIPKDQTSGAKLRMGEDLSKLGDDAFLRVVNGQVNPNPARNEAYGAIVGRNISDHAEQTAALQQLAKAAPDNAYQAEQFVKAIMADGFERGVQTNLFGEQEVANSLAEPIARVMAAARRTLQSDKSALGNALRNEERLAGRGNVLNREANQAGFESAGTLDRLLDTYGHTAGPVREELKRVAAEVQAGHLTPTAAANQILDAVERERGNLGTARPGVPPTVPANDEPRGPAPAAPQAEAPVAEAAPSVKHLQEKLARDSQRTAGESVEESVRKYDEQQSAPGKYQVKYQAPKTGELITHPELFATYEEAQGFAHEANNQNSWVKKLVQGSDEEALHHAEVAAKSSPIPEIPELPEATPAEVPGILQQLAKALNVENKPFDMPFSLNRESHEPSVGRQTSVFEVPEESAAGARKVERGDYTSTEKLPTGNEGLPTSKSDLPEELQSLDELQTRHGVRNPEKATEISESMKRVGWKGRPILVVKDDGKSVAWTGTHRLEAAKQAGLKPADVPRVEVNASALREAGFDVDELTKLGKKDRIAALRKAGQDQAADLLEEERGAKQTRERRQGTRASGTNPRALNRAEELLDAGKVDEAEKLMSSQIEARIQSAYKHGTGGENGGGSTVLGGLAPFDTETFRRLVTKHPETAWRATTTAIGGATGWYLDEDHPGRGVILGMMAGYGAGSVPKLVQALQTAEIKGRVAGKGVEPVRLARNPKKDIGLFELLGGTPERTIPEQFDRARPAFEKFVKALHEEHARTGEIIPQKKVQALRDRYVTPVITQIRKDATALSLDKANPQPYKQKYITAFANRLAGHRTIGQRVFQTLTKGKLPADFIERRVGSAIYYSGTGFAVDTALQNLTQPMLALGHVPAKFIAQAYKDLATSPAAKRLVEGALLPLEKPADAIETYLGPFGRKASKFGKSAVGKALDPQKLLRMTDQKNREVVYYAARKYAESRGLETGSADTWARQVMRKTQTEPGALGTNPFHAGPVAGSLRPFTKYPTVFTEHLIDLAKQATEGKNLGGAARLGGTLLGLIALGKATGIDMEDLLVSGGRPLGLDVNHPGRSLERVASGQATPASRGVFDLLAHLQGSADHSLGEDVKDLAIPRYARKLGDAIGHFTQEGTDQPHVTRGPGGKIRDVTTPGETVLNLLGVKTTRQTDRRHALQDFYDTATSQKDAYEKARRTAYEDLGRAIDSGDSDAVGDAVRRIGSTQAVRQFLRERRLLPEERFYKTLPPKIRQQLRGALNDTRDLAAGAGR